MTNICHFCFDRVNSYHEFFMQDPGKGVYWHDVKFVLSMRGRYNYPGFDGTIKRVLLGRCTIVNHLLSYDACES